jgi:hypothetical protein
MVELGGRAQTGQPNHPSQHGGGPGAPRNLARGRRPLVGRLPRVRESHPTRGPMQASQQSNPDRAQVQERLAPYERPSQVRREPRCRDLEPRATQLGNPIASVPTSGRRPTGSPQGGQARRSLEAATVAPTTQAARGRPAEGASPRVGLRVVAAAQGREQGCRNCQWSRQVKSEEQRMPEKYTSSLTRTLA